MNIFYLHPDPNKAAAYHYDKHKVKMILEAAQMLCTAHHHYAELYEYDAVIFLTVKKHIIITLQLMGNEKICKHIFLGI